MVRGATPGVVALERMRIAHTLHPYHHDPRSTAFGNEAVAALDLDARRVFKTLVARLDGAELVVAVVPVAAQLDLKALATALQGKKAAMAAVDAAERSSGYVAGGISPIGQRKSLRTVVDSSARSFETVFVSAGRRGLQVELTADDLVTVTRAVVADVASWA